MSDRGPRFKFLTMDSKTNVCTVVNPGQGRRQCWSLFDLSHFPGNNAPINSKLQHLPPGIPRAFDCGSCPGGGNLNVVLEAWGIWTAFISCSDVIRPWVFSVFTARVWRIYKIEFRLCQCVTLLKGSLKEVWWGNYVISLSEWRVKCLIEDEICLWGKVIQ